jgi:DNA polymerase I
LIGVADIEKALREEKARSYTAGYFDRDGVHLSFWKDDEKYLNSIDYPWFFYARAHEIKSHRREVERLSAVAGLEPTADDRWFKVFSNYFDRRDLIEAFDKIGVEPLEADVTPFDRYIAEHDVDFDPNPRVLWYDLETDGATGWDDIEGHRILSVAYREHGADKTTFRCVDSADDDGERKLLDGFLDVVGRHDLLVAWNGDQYDEIVLRARCKRLKFSPVWRLVNFLDMLELFKKYYGRDATGLGVRISFSLENIAQTVLGKGKIPDVPKHKMLEIWREQRELMEIYNIRDVDIMVELEEKLEYLKTHAILSHLCKRFLCSRALKQAYITDGFVLHYGAHNSEHFPTKRYGDDTPDREKFEGAHVEPPAKGLHEGVVDLDFSSLYPNIVMAFNISTETFMPEGKVDGVPTCTAANGSVFRTDVEGVFPAVSRIAVDGRQEFYQRAVALEKAGKEGTPEHLKALQTSAVYKILANAFFGGMGSPYARFYQPKCGEAITLTGQVAIKTCFDLARQKGIPVIYGDTDSAFLKCSVPIAEEFNELVAAALDEYASSRGARPGGFRLKVDAEFVRIFFTRKKRYAGKKATGKVDVRGLELVRSDKTKFERDLQKRIIEMILESRTPTARIAETIVRKWAIKLFKRELTADDLKYAETLSQPFEAYKAETIHVRIAKQLRDVGREVYVGMKIPYVLVGKEKDRDRLKAVHVDDFDGVYDAALYWEKTFPSTQRVLEVCFPDSTATWDRLLKWRPDAPQGDLFETPVELDDTRPIVFRFNRGDQDKLETLKAEMKKHPGEHPVQFDLRVDGLEVDLSTPVKVELRPELIKALEGIVRHRVYFGPEKWDREVTTDGQG